MVIIAASPAKFLRSSQLRSSEGAASVRFPGLSMFLIVSYCFFGSLLAEWLGKHPGFRGVSRSSSRRAKTNVGDLEFCVLNLFFYLYLSIVCQGGLAN